jgi:hypothetical protein
MSVQVIDRNGKIIALPAGAPIPPGCRLHVPPAFMDSKDRAAIEGLRERKLDREIEKLDREIEQLDREIEELNADDDEFGDDLADETLSDEERAGEIRARAYYKHRAAIDTANNRRKSTAPARRQPVRDPSYQSAVPWRPRGKFGNDGVSADSDPEAIRADAYAEFKARLHTADRGGRSRSSSSSGATDAASGGRLAEIERLQRAFAKR